MPESTRRIGEEAPTHFIGIPSPYDITAFGGSVGTEYLFTVGANIAERQGEGWKVTQGVPVLTIHDPDDEERELPNVHVMSRGEPIPASNPANGARRWWVDTDIDDFLTPSKPELVPPPNKKPAPKKGANADAG